MQVLVKHRMALMEGAKAEHPEPVGLVLQDEAKVVLELREMLPRLLLVVVALLEHFVDIRTLVADNPWIVLLVAALVGIIWLIARRRG